MKCKSTKWFNSKKIIESKQNLEENFTINDFILNMSTKSVSYMQATRKVQAYIKTI